MPGRAKPSMLGTSSRWQRALRVGLLSLAGGFIGGCALSPESNPQAIRQQELPHGLLSSPPGERGPSPGPGGERVIIYLESSNDHLVAVRRRVRRPADVAAVLGQLSEGPTVRESAAGLASPASSVGLITSRGLGNGVLSVNLPTSFQDLDGNGQTVAAAQIVFSVTTFSNVRGVTFYVSGQPAQVPDDNGNLRSGPSTRADFRSLIS